MVHIILIVLFMMILSTDVDSKDIMTKLSPFDGAPYDSFGGAVSIHGEIAIIGSYYDDSVRGSAYIFEQQSSGNWSLAQKIMASDRSNNGYFGLSVSVYEETAIIGAYGSVSAYIFERQINGTWIEIQQITGSDTVNGDWFGYAVSIYEDIAVIGAPHDDNNGAVFVFQQQANGEWVEWQKLTASDQDGFSDKNFGYATDIYNDTIIIGACGSNQTYIFEVSDNDTWIETSILSATSDSFGWTVSVFDDKLIVGAWGDDTIATQAGAAYIYTKTDGDLWQLNQTVFASDAEEYDAFGASVSIYNQTIVVGAWGDSGVSGSAYIFTKNSGGDWIETAKITAFDGSAGHYFGTAVSIHDDDILIGAPRAVDESGSLVGAAYIMENWNSCNEIWIESDDDQLLINTTNRYLVNWQWINCTFTASPTQQPTEFTAAPSIDPSLAPSHSPSKAPSIAPSDAPSDQSTLSPSNSPSTAQPSFDPTIEPTAHPSAHPTTSQPTLIPSTSSTNSNNATLSLSDEVVFDLWLIIIIVVVVCILNAWVMFICRWCCYKKKDPRNVQDDLSQTI